MTRSLRNRRPANCDKVDDPAVSLESNLYGRPLAGSLWERKMEEILRQGNEEKWFLSVKVDDIKMVCRKERLAPKLRKKVEFEAPTTLITSIKCTWDALTEHTQSKKKRLNQTPTRFAGFESQV